MACIKFTPPVLPPLAAGFGLPPLVIPSFSGNVNLCCHLNLFTTPPINVPLPGIPGAVLTAINAGIATIDAYLAALDLISLSCPLD